MRVGRRLRVAIVALWAVVDDYVGVVVRMGGRWCALATL
jgi:hypothetical protein